MQGETRSSTQSDRSVLALVLALWALWLPGLLGEDLALPGGGRRRVGQLLVDLVEHPERLLDLRPVRGERPAAEPVRVETPNRPVPGLPDGSRGGCYPWEKTARRGRPVYRGS